MLNLSEYRKKPKRLADKLVWFGLVDKGVILNKTGTFQRSAELMGFDLETSSVDLLDTICNKLNHVFKQLGSGWALYFDVVRTKTITYPESDFPEPLSRLIDLERKALFETECNFFESKYYLTFVYLPKKDSELTIANKFIENTGVSLKIDRGKDIREFKKATDRLIDSLRFSFLHARALTDAETLTYLHSTISPKCHPVKLPNPPVYLDYMLSDTPLLGGLEPKLGDFYFKTLSINFLPHESWPCILDGLNHLNIEFRWTTRWISLDQDEAKAQIEAKIRGWMSKKLSLTKMVGKMLNITSSAESDDAGAMNLQNDAENAKLLVNENQVSFGFYTATIIVLDQNLDACNNKLMQIANFINNKGFVCKVETVNAKEAWLGSVPGHTHANVRYPLISTINLAHLISISSAWAGHEKNYHFAKKFNQPAPLMITQTEGNTPFRLVLHQKDIGHTLILGPTGAGKSTLLNMIALQFLRYRDAQVFVFDKGFSGKVLALATGGTYYQFDRGASNEAMVMQPLKDIDDAGDRDWASGWVQSILVQQGLTITPEQKQELWNALTNLATREKKHRTLLNLKISLHDKKMSAALEPFVTGGAYGYLLDGDNENFSLAPWIDFELSILMEKAKEAVEPVLTCLFHKLEKRFTGKPTLLILDEAWTYLKNEIFMAKIQKWLRELRKNEVSVIFASQSLADAIDTPLMSIILESCKTKILLPNKEAMNPVIKILYQKMGLNDAQIGVIANAIPARQYFYHSADGVRLFDMALGDLALAVCANAGEACSALCDSLIQSYGKEQFLLQWLKTKNVTWAVKLLEENISASSSPIEQALMGEVV